MKIELKSKESEEWVEIPLTKFLKKVGKLNHNAIFKNLKKGSILKTASEDLYRRKEV